MENIKQMNCTDSYVADMARYSIITNRRRSIPDRKDGLKPVQRRTLYVFYNDLHALTESTKAKSAQITGRVIGEYHPHSTDSVYGSLVNMSQPFSCRVPLISSKSNMGTIMGDSAAADRYTEAWLSSFALDNVIGAFAVSKDVVDMSLTYTEKRMEPDYFPVRVPLLLINGAYGIGLGMMTEIPKHNLNEVVDATLRLMDNPNADVILIPDHCLPCNIIDTNWKAICNKGNGKYKVRSVIDIVEDKKGIKSLRIRSVPDRVTTGRITEEINKLISDNKLPQITSVDDASKREVNIIVELKKGSDAQFVREALYKYTHCEDTFKVNFEVIDGIEPIRMSYKSYLLSFIDFAMANKFREYCNRMKDVNTRYHQIDAYIKVLRSGEIDKIISLIKKQSSVDDNYLIEYLIKKIGLTDLQATFIINANIKRLSIGYLIKYEEEAAKLIGLKNDYLQRIVDDSFIRDEVRKDLLDAKSKYGSPRMCKVIKVSDDSNIPKGTFKLIVTENNYIRKIGDSELVTTVRGDTPNFVLKVDNTENILLFDDKGKVFKLPVHKIPVMERSDQGIDVRTVLRGLTARVVEVIYEFGLKEVSRHKTKCYIAAVSKGNLIKKLDIEDFLNVQPSGIIYAKLNAGDSIISVKVVSDNMDAILYSEQKALRLSVKEIPNYKRNTLGVAAMNLKPHETITGLSVVYPKCTDILVITKRGQFNKFNIAGLEKDKRNRSGTKVIKLSKGDSIHSIYTVDDNINIRVVTGTGVVEIPVTSIASNSSISPGTKMIPTKSDQIMKTDLIYKI